MKSQAVRSLIGSIISNFSGSPLLVFVIENPLLLLPGCHG